ncbi:MAG: HEAT repeat domain-containing protein, partial [Planctomycetota bacterium]|nr:HEAT repeat domain-containing protein [Planctomycetota bacterium]
RFDSEMKMLASPDTFARFQAVGRIGQVGAEILPTLVEALEQSEHRQFNRDIVECLSYLFAQGKITDRETPLIVRLLKARDREVRTLIADNFGVFGLAGGVDALVEAMKTDADPQVRRFAIRSLFRMKSPKGLPTARELALKDDSYDVRRMAAIYVARVRDEVDPFPVLIEQLRNDPAPCVRVMACDGIGYLKDKRAIEDLRAASAEPDVYIQRAAAKALCEIGHAEGIGVLIESLTFPSIDAFWNYGNNVPNFIAIYAGTDLPGDDRYSQDKWRQWFKENRDRIDIKSNVDAYNALMKVTETFREIPPAEQIRKLEELAAKYPGSERIRKVLSEKLNEVAWNMVTADRSGPAFDAQQGLKYAKRAVELNPDPQIVDTLAEAYFVNGLIDDAMKVCTEMLDKNPKDGMFIERLEKLRKAKGGE